MLKYGQHLDETLDIIKTNSPNNEYLDITIQIMKKYISSLIEFGYIDFVNFNSVISYLNSITIEFTESNDPFTIFIDFNNTDENIIITICQKVGEYLLNTFHKENISKFSLLTSTNSEATDKDIENGLYTINKALSYELAYQVYEYQTKEIREVKKMKTEYFTNSYLSSWFKDNDIEESVKLFCGYLYRSNKEECMGYLSRKSFDNFLYPQIVNTKVNNIGMLLSALGIINMSLTDSSVKENALLAAKFLEQNYNQVKIPINVK